MKDLTLNCEFIRHLQVFSIPLSTDLSFLDFIDRLSCVRAEKFSQSAPEGNNFAKILTAGKSSAPVRDYEK